MFGFLQPVPTKSTRRRGKARQDQLKHIMLKRTWRTVLLATGHLSLRRTKVRWQWVELSTKTIQSCALAVYFNPSLHWHQCIHLMGSSWPDQSSVGLSKCDSQHLNSHEIGLAGQASPLQPTLLHLSLHGD